MIVGSLVVAGFGFAVVPAHAAVDDGRCTVTSTTSSPTRTTYRIALPAVVREGPADTCVRVADARVVDAAILRPLLATKALVVIPPTPPRTTPTRPRTPPVPTPTVPVTSAPAAPPPTSGSPVTPAPGAPPATGVGVPPTSTAPPVAPPVAAPVATPGALPAAAPPFVVFSAVPLTPPITGSASPGTAGDGSRLGVDLLAPGGAAPAVDPGTLVGAPGQAADPETVVLRTLGESDPTGVHSATEAEGLAAQRRPGLGSAALGAAILAGLAGFAVRRRTLNRYRRPAVGGAGTPRLVEVTVRSRPDVSSCHE